MSNSNLEKVISIGWLSASIFAREVDQNGSKRTYRSVSLQKSYRDPDDSKKRKYGTSFDYQDLPALIRVAQLAQAYIESHEAEVVSAD